MKDHDARERIAQLQGKVALLDEMMSTLKHELKQSQLAWMAVRIRQKKIGDAIATLPSEAEAIRNRLKAAVV